MSQSLKPLLLFLVVAAGLFGALFGLLLWSGGIFVIEQAIASMAASFMTALSPADMHREVLVRARESQLEYHMVLTTSAGRHPSAAAHPLHVQNLVLFASLVLASPGLVWRTRLIAFVLGLLAVWLVDVTLVMGDLWRIEYKALGEVAQRNPAIAEVLATYTARLHPTGAIFFALPFLWGFFLLGPLRPAPDSPAEAKPRKGNHKRSGKARKRARA